MAVDGLEWSTHPGRSFAEEWEGSGEFLGTNKTRNFERSPEEWVAVADALSKKHNGVLPYGKWLSKNGYSGLNKAMYRRPELFAHIKQSTLKGKTQEEWVSIAETLANKNGGVLPNCGWMINNGYSGLYKTIRLNPELFAHIRQYKKRRSPEEWVTIAEELAVEHGGMLPNCKWLQKNGYNGLDQVMRINPELFEHIQQEIRSTGTNGRVVAIRVNGQITSIQREVA